MGIEAVVADGAGITRLATGLVERARSARDHRYLLGIAGIGGSGKSTLASRLVAAVDEVWPGACRFVGMDGFHFPNAELARRGLGDRKGAPETFDVEGFLALLRRARDPNQRVDVPVYDREKHDPVLPLDDAHAIDQRTRLVIAEGNYLLLALPPWAQLGELFDETWFLDTPLDLARQWIVGRHVRGGRPRKDAKDWYQRVDLPNAQLILAHRRAADVVVRLPGCERGLPEERSG